MIQELFSWLDAQRITYIPVDTEVVDIPGFGRLFTADLSGVESIFRGDGDKLVFNLMESPDVLMEEGIFHVAFPFGRNWYYYDLREEFRFNLLKYIGRPKPPVHDVPFVNLGIHTSYELLNACCSPEDLCRKAKWLGHTAVGICDRNTMAATLNLQKECANTGLKHIFGYSLTMMHEEERVGLKIYALDNEGLHNLLRIQRAVMVDSEDNTLRYEQLLMYAAGCVVVFAIRSVYWMAGHPKQVKRIRKGAEAVYYQVDANEYKADRIDREQLEALKYYFGNCYDADTDSFTVEPVLIPDCYYMDKDDAGYRIVVNKIATGAAHEQSDDQYFKTADELYDTLRPLFSGQWDFDSLFRRMCVPRWRLPDVRTPHSRPGECSCRNTVCDRKSGNGMVTAVRCSSDCLTTGWTGKCRNRSGNAIGNGWTRKSISLNRPTMWTISWCSGIWCGRRTGEASQLV